MAERFANELKSTAAHLTDAQIGNHRALIGFDGFVDEIIDVVQTRTSADEYERIPTIEQLGQRILGASGLSTNLEMVTTQQKIGGNGPIMSNALIDMGMPVTYIGCLGYPTIHPVFEEFAVKANAISIADPGSTDALEFSDGKVMLGKIESLKDVRWDRITDRIPASRLMEEAKNASLIGALNWTMLPYLTEVWSHFLADVLPDPKPGQPMPITFFDLCDPEKREKHEIKEAVEMIQSFRAKSRPVLGLNRKEATEVADALGLHVQPSNEEASLDAITLALGEALDLYALVVHPTDAAAVYTDGQLYVIEGPYTSDPQLTTGAGDNFNAGFCLGMVHQFEPAQWLILGKGVSGFYVRNRRSPNQQELAGFLQLWSQHVGGDF